MPAASLTSRRWRWQFSLRAVLVVMAVLGVVIVILRRPWVETKDESWIPSALLYGADGPGTDSNVRKSNRWQNQWQPCAGRVSKSSVNNYRVTTMYRRGWNGKPQRHGWQEYWRLAERRMPALVMQKHYVDDDLRRLIHYDTDSGQIIHSEGRLNGVPHGNYKHVGFHETEQGEYHQGKRVGAWESIYSTSYFNNRERITRQSSYRDGLLHGQWTWNRVGDSENLQTARFEAGRLVECNSVPKQAAIQQLLERCTLTKELRTKLQQSSANAHITTQRNPTINAWDLQIDGKPTGFAVHTRAASGFDMRALVLDRNREFEFPAGESPLETLLESALADSQTLTVRSGKLFLVRISAAELEEMQ
jgi:hypothetical protein